MGLYEGTQIDSIKLACPLKHNVVRGDILMVVDFDFGHVVKEEGLEPNWVCV